MTVSVRQGRAAADPIGVALLITAGKRSAPADSPPHYSDPIGVELPHSVVRARGYVARGLGG